MTAAATRRLRGNHQGSIVAVADNAGAPIAINAYDEWGIPAATNVGRFQYTGQIWLPELGLYYYKARIYSPTLGRFMQTDPIGYEDQVNLYAYVGNDPVNMVDPDGKVAQAIFGAVIGAGLDVGFQVLVQGKSLKNVNLTSVAISAVAGAAGIGLLKNAGRILSADLKAVKAGNAAARAATRAGRLAAEGSKRQARNASFNSGVKAAGARAANSKAAQVAAKAVGGLAGVAAAKQVAPPITCGSLKVCK